MKDILASLVAQDCLFDFEVIVVEDGSDETSKSVVAEFQNQLHLRYFFIENRGAGLARNFGMQQAKSDFFIIFDSDCVLPSSYLNSFETAFKKKRFDFYGGPDTASPDFNAFQKAVSYAMTSLLTTGGLRGHKKNKSFQPRSFNLGMSRAAFEASNGFNDFPIGEDIDLSFRLCQLGFKAVYLPETFVYHKRRTNLKLFFKQTFKFGHARPFLNKLHPGTSKITYWFPSFFTMGLLVVTALFLIYNINIGVLFYVGYLLLLVTDASIKNKSLKVGLLSVLAAFTQFCGYGLGFLKGLFRKNIQS